jgi:Short C-terminal domain
MGLLGDMFKGVRMKDPVRGQAQVVSCTGHRGDGIWQNCRMQLVVQAEGVPATSAEHSELVHNQKWPMPGMTLPVTVDRADPKKFKIEWDEVQDSRSRAAANADAMAAMMRGETPPGGVGAFGGANVQVINASGTDPRLLPEEKRAKLRMLGIDPDQLAVQQGFGPAPSAQPPQAPAAESGDEVDDQLARLAKLGELRDSGVLTPEEFEQQKKRILEG